MPPKLAVGDGALGFWNALTKHGPTTVQQPCWVHKTANVLSKVRQYNLQSKSGSGRWMAETQDEAHKAFDLCVTQFEVKYPKAMARLNKDRALMLAFHDYLAEHWIHIRTTNPIESAFSTIR